MVFQLLPIPLHLMQQTGSLDAALVMGSQAPAGLKQGRLKGGSFPSGPYSAPQFWMHQADNALDAHSLQHSQPFDTDVCDHVTMDDVAGAHPFFQTTL